MFFTPALVLHWCLSDSKSPSVSRTLVSIQADLNNAIVWMVSTCLLISKSSRSFGNYSKRTNYNWYPRYLHFSYLFSSLARSKYVSLFLRSFLFTLWSAETEMFTIRQVLFIIIIIIIISYAIASYHFT